MNENARKWVAALRSGQYQQGRTYLQKDNRFCCLGVACDLHSPENWVREEEWFPSEPVRNHLGTTSIPQDPVLAHFGIDIEFAGTLADMNDRGSSFAEIADYIEENLK